jgi:hypothetical protein
MRFRAFQFALILLTCAAASTHADPLARPGDMLVRHDIKLLVDEGVIDVPVGTWPIPWEDIFTQLDRVQVERPSLEVAGAMTSLKDRAREELDKGGNRLTAWASVAANPRVIRTFEDTPREDAEAGLAFSWTGNRFMANLSAAYAHNPLDGEEFRPDDSYLGMSLGNWMVMAGWQQRWWGPGNDASSIMSTNARPRPGITLQRNLSTPFETKWLSWLGPWTLTTFMEHLDDERATKDPLLWGFRFGFRPLKGLEINVTRTAMWCGDGRPCDLGTFLDVLKGNDNKGQNTTPEDEPGNQMAGYDIRWSLPKEIPVALYMQWTAEDGRPQGVPLGSLLRLVGAEYWGTVGRLAHRTHVEVADTMCREGGFGFGDKKPDCAYNHPLYPTGYRYNRRVMGHSIDGDGRSFSLGSTLVQEKGQTWNLTLRYMQINMMNVEGNPNRRHSLSPTPQDRADIQLTHVRSTSLGRIHIGIGYSYLDDEATGANTSDITGFVSWSTR